MNPVTAIIQRNLLNYTRNRGRMIGSMVMSMFMLVMFSFMMKSSMSGFGGPMNYLIAGVIIMTVFQTGINNSSDILSDISDGYMKEVMVAPVARSQISIGNILSGAVVSTIQGTLTIIISLFIGFRINVLQVLLLIVVMLVSAMTFSAAGYEGTIDEGKAVWAKKVYEEVSARYGTDSRMIARSIKDQPETMLAIKYNEFMEKESYIFQLSNRCGKYKNFLDRYTE